MRAPPVGESAPFLRRRFVRSCVLRHLATAPAFDSKPGDAGAKTIAKQWRAEPPRPDPAQPPQGKPGEDGCGIPGVSQAEAGADQDLIARMTSISTEIWLGSEPMPTAERACLPASPNTSTNKSEQPLITFGCSLKSGTALTIPSIFTTKSTRSSEPSAWRVAASSPSPTRRARL